MAQRLSVCVLLCVAWVCGVVCDVMGGGYANMSLGMTTRGADDPHYSIAWHLHPMKNLLLGSVVFECRVGVMCDV